MYRKTTFLQFLLSIVLLAGCQSQLDTSALSFAENNGGITLPDGFTAVVVADSIGSARHLTVDDDGDIYVALDREHNGNGIAALRDTTGDGIADITEYFGDYTGTGIALYNGYLYFAPDSSVIRYSMQGDDLVPETEPEIVVSGFPIQNQHEAKSITFDDRGYMYVNVGAPANACQEQMRTPLSPGQDPCPLLEWHGGIWRFDARSTEQTQQADGHRYATGIRNAVALEWNTAENQLYLVQHGRDQLNTLWPEHYDSLDNAELPSEEFFKVDDGDNFGWPYTYYDHLKGQKMLNPEYGGDGEIPASETDYEFEDPILAFPGHWAPNDLLFNSGSQFPDEYRGGAFIAFHGSWNRSPLPQQGYRVTFVPFEGDEPAGDSYETFAIGFAARDTIETSRDAEHRPMGLASGRFGTLYIVDSVEGKLWRVVYTGTGDGEYLG